MANKIKALIYCRVSSQKQVNEGHGLDSQELRCIKYAQQNGYEVADIFREEGVSGGLFERPAMKKLLEYMDQHKNERFVVIFDDLKRLARDTVVHFGIKKEIYTRGGRVESLNFKFEDSPENKFIETIMAGAAELERLQNKRQVNDKMRARLEKGYWVFSAPLGYMYKSDPIHGKILVIEDEKKAKLIKQGLEGFATDIFATQSDLLQFWQESGLLSRKGSIVNHLTQVDEKLRCILYTGYIEYKKWDFPRTLGHHSSIISLDTFETIQDKLNGRSRKKFRQGIRDSEFPLRDFIYCKECGHRLTGSIKSGRNSRKYASYHCYNKSCNSYGHSLKASKVEQDFIDLVGQLCPTKELLDTVALIVKDLWDEKMKLIKQDGSTKQRNEIIIEEKIRKLISLAVKTQNEAVRNEYEKEIQKLTFEKDSLNLEITKFDLANFDFGTALNKVIDKVGNPVGTWTNGDYASKRLVPELVFSGRLEYSLKNGFGNADLSVPYRLFEELRLGNSPMVDRDPEIWQQFIDYVINSKQSLKL